MQATLRRLKTEAVEIPYYTWEVPEPSAVLIFLHGLKSHAGWFLRSGEEFAARSVKAYVFDRRGSGLSERARGDVERYGDWLEDIHAMVSLAKRENPSASCHLLGHCFGAKLALGYVLLHPGEVQSLALIAPPQGALKADLTPWQKMKAACALLGGGSLRIPVPIKDEMFTRVPDMLDFIRGDSLRLGHITARFCMEVRKIDRWIDRHLEEIRLPLLVLLAKEDPVVDVAKVKNRFLPKLANAEKSVAEFDCYHHLLFEPLRERVIGQIAGWVHADGKSF